MQIQIESDLLHEVVEFVGAQPCKTSYVLYTKLLLASRCPAPVQEQPVVPAVTVTTEAVGAAPRKTSRKKEGDIDG